MPSRHICGHTTDRRQRRRAASSSAETRFAHALGGPTIARELRSRSVPRGLIHWATSARFQGSDVIRYRDLNDLDLDLHAVGRPRTGRARELR
jgi:hypothetical protein